MIERRVLAAVLFVFTTVPGWSQIPINTWVELCQDSVGARRGSAVHYVPDAEAFFLWGFMNADPELLQEHPLMEIPEYDVVFYQPGSGKWQNHLPKEWEGTWSNKLPLEKIMP